MSYSTIEDPEITVKRTNLVPLLDGSSSLQELGYVSKTTIKFGWITTEEFEAEIEAKLGGDWALDGEPSRTLVSEAVPDLFFAEASFIKYSSL